MFPHFLFQPFNPLFHLFVSNYLLALSGLISLVGLGAFLKLRLEAVDLLVTCPEKLPKADDLGPVFFLAGFVTGNQSELQVLFEQL